MTDVSSKAAYSAAPDDAGAPREARLPAACPVAYCRGEAGHRTLHDIPACLSTCGPIRPGLGREHDTACPNAAWRRP